MGATADGGDHSDDDLDRARLQALAERLAQPAAEVAATLHDELVAARSQIEAGLRTGDLTAVGHGAHGARNSALMVGAGPLLAGLRALEQAAGRGESDQTRRAWAQTAERAQRLIASLRAVG